jgi:NAD(P)-dependent dehydrogenase (short-subunit alcohol dehydrogenase family)
MRTVLITGASSGIGRLTAELMSRHGWQVAATARDPAALDWAQGPHVAAFRLDVTDEASVETAVAAVVQRFGGLDVLVNNAGFGLFGPLEGATREDIERQFRTNVLGPITLIRAVLPHLRARRGGTIVNISSIAGRTATPFASLYHASKFALEGLSESLRFEAALHGVRVKLVEPGHVKTDFFGRSFRLARHPAYEAALDNYMQWVYRQDRRAPGPEKVAQTILRAAEDGSARLRYPVHGAAALALAALLPDALWRSLLAAGMTRRPRSARDGGDP